LTLVTAIRRIQVGRVLERVGADLAGRLDGHRSPALRRLHRALVGQDPAHRLVAAHRRHFLVPRKTTGQIEQVGGDLFQGLLRLGWLGHREDALSLAGEVPIGERSVKRFEEIPVMAFEVDEKRPDHPHEDPDPPQVAHVRLDVDRVEPLGPGVHGEDPGQLVGDLGKQYGVQFLFGQDPPHRPQRPGANVLGGIRLPVKVQSKMPLDRKGQLPDRFLVVKIKHLLEDQGAQGGVHLLGGASVDLVERGGQFLDGQLREDLPAEETGPGIVEEFAPFGSHVGPFVEKLPGFAVPCVEHAILP